MIWTVIIGGIAGWLAGKLMRGEGYGILIDILLGIVGGWIGGWIFGLLGLYSSGGLLGALVVSTLGAVILIWIIHRIKN